MNFRVLALVTVFEVKYRMALTEEAAGTAEDTGTDTDSLNVEDMALRPLALEELNGVNGAENEPEPLREAIIKGKVPGDAVGPEIRAELENHFYYKGEVVHRDELDGQGTDPEPGRAHVHTWEKTVKGPELDKALSDKIYEDTGPNLRSGGLGGVFGASSKGVNTAYRDVNADPKGPDMQPGNQPDPQLELQRAMQMSPPPPSPPSAPSAMT